MSAVVNLKTEEKDILKWYLFPVVLAFSFSVFITHVLWHRTGRTFPVYSFFDLGNDNTVVFQGLSILFVLSFIICLLPGTMKYGLIASISLWIIFVFFDLNCLQPSFYFYSAVLFILFLNQIKVWDYYQSVTLVRHLLACIYIFGGIHKLNEVYNESVFQWLIQVYHNWLGNSWAYSLLEKAGPVSPFIEILTGIGLLFPSTVKPAACMAVLMHLFILGAIGPWGHDFNLVILPWNLVMLFINLGFIAGVIGDSNISGLFKNKAAAVFLGVNWLVPVAGWCGVTDSYLSHDLYSGKANFGFILLPKDSLKVVPAAYRNQFEPYSDTKSYAALTQWSLKELGVPVYPEKRVYLHCKKEFEKFFPLQPETVELIITNRKKNETYR